jgi:hypothetical protein
VIAGKNMANSGGAAMGDAGTNQQPKKMVVVTEAADARIRGVRFSYHFAS